MKTRNLNKAQNHFNWLIKKYHDQLAYAYIEENYTYNYDHDFIDCFVNYPVGWCSNESIFSLYNHQQSFDDFLMSNDNDYYFDQFLAQHPKLKQSIH